MKRIYLFIIALWCGGLNLRANSNPLTALLHESCWKQAPIHQNKPTPVLSTLQPVRKLRIPAKRSTYERLTFNWCNRLMQIGNQRPLQLSDVWVLAEKHQIKSCSNSLSALLSNGSLSDGFISRSPVVTALVKTYRRDIIVTGALKLATTLIQFLPPLLVSRILSALGASTIPANGPLAVLPDFLQNKALLLSAALFFILCFKTVLENQYFDRLARASTEAKATLSAVIYQKALRLGPSSRRNVTMGEVVNLMQLDTTRIEYSIYNMHTTWDGVLQIVGYTFLLVQFLGPSVFAGIAAMLFVIPINSILLRRLAALKDRTSKVTDRRVRLSNEVLQGMKAIKSYNWESPFASRVQGVRNEELVCLKETAYIRALLVLMLSVTPPLVATVTLAVYAASGNVLEPMKVFTALTLFQQLRVPVIFFPVLMNTIIEGRSAVKRLTNFLNLPEMENYVVRDSARSPDARERRKRRKSRSRPVICVQNATFGWHAPSISMDPSASNGSRDVLRNVTLDVPQGSLVAIVGPSGSGKSTLLQAVMGEMHYHGQGASEGGVLVRGRVAYVPQAAWIPQGTVESAVTFGNEYNGAKFTSAVTMCLLRSDIREMAAAQAGENGYKALPKTVAEQAAVTEIGERGTTLSGGQRQRLSMARAVYDDADIYLLDDPLSALDSAVGSRLFHDCVVNGLAGKTRILVTHQLNVLSQVDHIILMGCEMNRGNETCADSAGAGSMRILDQGTLRELVQRGHNLTQFVVPQNHTECAASAVIPVDGSTVPTPQQPQGASGVPKVGEQPVDDAVTQTRTPHEETIEELAKIVAPDYFQPVVVSEALLPGDDILPRVEDLKHVVKGETAPICEPSLSVTGEDLTIIEANHAVPRAKSMMVQEERTTGAVGYRIYRQYLQYTRRPELLAVLLTMLLAGNAFGLLQQWTVAAWTSDPQYNKHTLATYLFRISMCAALVGATNFLRTYSTILMGISASKNIHKQMVFAAMRAPLQFYETTPVGRLVQRFAKDLDQIDQHLPAAIGQQLSSVFTILTSLCAILLSTPSAAISLSVIFAFYFMVTNYYRTVARELKRVEAVSRSPIVSLAGETLQGLPVIRSFRRQGLFTQRNEEVVDDNFAVNYALKVIDRWLSVRLEVLGNLLVLSASLLAVWSRPSSLSTAFSTGAAAAVGAQTIASHAGKAGLSLNSALGVTSLLNWVVRNAADTESLMNSVERVGYTINHSTQEAPTVMQRYEDMSQVFPLNASYYASIIPPYWKIASEPNILVSVPPIGAAQNATVSLPVGNQSHTEIRRVELPQSDYELLQSGWPYRGEITFRNTHMRYRPDMDFVLKGVNITIAAGEKVGVVGRTGSGKSSLFRALLRLTECSTSSSEGDGILIDGVDISRIGLDALRSSIAVISQEPALFSGTIRSNLDPFQQHSDLELWTALRKAQLDFFVLSLPGGLHHVMQEGGENLSAGQRQLLCLARVLVRHKRILLLDEATSNVDYDTDVHVQRTIKEEFGAGGGTGVLSAVNGGGPAGNGADRSTTVLTIAHRLSSVVDGDKVLVMERGSAVEYDTPENLLLAEASTDVYMSTEKDNDEERSHTGLFARLLRAEQQIMKRIPDKGPQQSNSSSPAEEEDIWSDAD